MRSGVSSALREAHGARQLSGVSLVALLCASALAPVLAAGTAPLAAMAAIGVLGSVGANVLTDVIGKAVDRLRDRGVSGSEPAVRSELMALLEQRLSGPASSAADLRVAAAELLQRVDAVAAVVEDLQTSNTELLPAVAQGFADLGARFDEFAFTAQDMRLAVWRIEESLRDNWAGFRAEQERARQASLTLLASLEKLQHRVANPQASPALADEPWAGCPYPGLAPFAERDARIFYGRDELVQQLTVRLWEQLSHGGFLVIVGASGAGKSSLLRAGLMPRLAAGVLGQGSDSWPRRTIRPGSSPLAELAQCLATLAGTDAISAYNALLGAPEQAPMLARQAARSAVGYPVGQALAEPDDGAGVPEPRLVIAIDQFEEMFTRGDDSAQASAGRSAFVAALHAMATAPVGGDSGPVALVMLAVRGDYLERAMTFGPVKNAVERAPFVVGEMTRPELRKAITGPAAEAGLTVDRGLVKAVVGELGGTASSLRGSSVLPLLSQAMAATWERREGSKLTLRAYQRAGGVADAVNRSAHDAYASLTARQRAAARGVFTRLCVVSADGTFARARCSRADLLGPDRRSAADAEAVIEAFRGRRLITMSGAGIEISHDILLESWRQLRDWLSDDLATLALISQVQADAQTWDASHRDPAYLYRQGRLAAVSAASAEWAAAPHRYPALGPVTVAFLDAARQVARRAAKVRRGVAAAVIALALIASGAAIAAVRNASAASRAATTAERNAASSARQHAIALSRQLAAESANAAALDQPVIARQLAVAAWRVSPTSQAAAAMAGLVAAQQQGSLLPAAPTADTGSVMAIAFSPDGRLLATGDDDGTVRLWATATSAPVRTMHVRGAPSGGSGVGGVAFSPDGKTLATADDNSAVKLWDTGSGKLLRTMRPPAAVANATGTAFSPDGRLLAVSYTNGQVWLWDAATWQPARVIDANYKPGYFGGGYGVNAVSFSPDGKLLATADDNGATRLWLAATGRPVHTLKAAIPAVDGVGGVAFSPDGRLLAAGDGNGALQVWNLAAGRAAITLGHSAVGTGGAVYRVAFSPHGRYIAAASLDGEIRMWNLGTGRLVLNRAAGGSAAPGEVAFSPDGRRLAATDGDGTVQLLSTVTALPAGLSLQGGSAAAGVSDVAFSPDGGMVAGARADGTVWLWNGTTGQRARVLPVTSARDGVSSVLFSPDGGVLLSVDNDFSRGGVPGAGADGIARLWDPATGRLIAALQRDVAVAAFSPDGRLLATGGAGGNGSIKLWNTVTGRLITVLRPPAPNSDGAADLVFSRDGKLLAGIDGGGDVIRLWDVVTGRLVRTWHASNSPNGLAAIAFSPVGDTVASGGAGDDDVVRLWSAATGRLIRALRITSSYGIDDVAFSPDGKVLASADANGNIQLWSARTGEPVGTPLGTASPANADSVTISIAFSPDSKILAGTAADGTIQLWDTATGRAISGPFGPAAHQSSTSITFSPDGTLLAELSGRGAIRMWRVAGLANAYATLCADVGSPTRATWAVYAAGEKEPGICPSAERDNA